MTRMLSISLVLVFLFSVVGCTYPGPEGERLLNEYSLIMKAFEEKNIEAILPYVPDEFTRVSDGQVTTITKEEWQQQTKTAFEFVDFLEYTNVTEPKINFSKDCSVAWMVVNEKSKLKVTDPQKLEEFIASLPDDEREETERYFQKEEIIEATLYIWEKINSKWVVTTVASTEKKDLILKIWEFESETTYQTRQE